MALDKDTLKTKLNRELSSVGNTDNDLRKRSSVVNAFNDAADGNNTPESILIGFLTNLHDIYQDDMHGGVYFDNHDSGTPKACLESMRAVARELNKQSDNNSEIKKFLEFIKIFDNTTSEDTDTKVLFTTKHGGLYQSQAAILGLDYYLSMHDLKKRGAPYHEACEAVAENTTWRTATEQTKCTFTLLKNAHAHASLYANSLDISAREKRAKIENADFLKKNPTCTHD